VTRTSPGSAPIASTTSDASPAEISYASVIPLVPAWRVDRAFDYSVPEKLARRVSAGTLVRIPFGGRKVRGIVLDVTSVAPERQVEDIAGVVVDVPLAPPPADELLDWVATRYVAPRGRVYSRVVPPRVRVKTEPPPDEFPVPALKILEGYDHGIELASAITAGGSGTWCFRSVAGEDRGAVIAELIGRVLEGDGASLVTVPEVRHGSTTLDRIKADLPSLRRVDSSLDDADRAANWIALARGHRVAGGGRASVLAPIPNLRLLVVDDEHHKTYKEDRSPRYDARRVAIERARLQGAICVLLSSTPSLETGAAARAGAYREVRPTRDMERGARPLIEFVPKNRDRAIGHELHERIRDTLRSGRRVALLAPMTGYARALWCSSCRRSIRCRRCEAGMVYGSARTVRCPRCGLTEAAPDVCPHCGSTEFRYLGAGSERLAEQLRKSFPRATVARVDTIGAADLVAGDRSQADIYLATWIGTKEAIRPDVSLVGVIDADALIRRPDWRSSEDAYQALVEMSEWAGPARDGGRLLIQTDESAHHSLQALARADYSFFLQRELAIREELAYPPFAELIKVTAAPEKGRSAIEEIRNVARGHGARVLGPIEAGVAGDRRLEILLKCPSVEAIARDLRGILSASTGDARLRIDVDPR
jgi:primosomal protein N' (replication factor Y)